MLGFMNAIDQQCEYYIKENSLEKGRGKINAIYKAKGVEPSLSKVIYQ
jgi:methylmalonyl-CoA mutase